LIRHQLTYNLFTSPLVLAPIYQAILKLIPNPYKKRLLSSLAYTKLCPGLLFDEEKVVGVTHAL
jgi:hypothetical protein